jgi:hypothetical protein
VEIAIKDRADIVDLALTFSASASKLDATKLSQTFTADGILAGVAKLVGQGDIDITSSKSIAGFFDPIFKTLQFVHHTSQVVGLVVTGDKATATTMIIEYARPKEGGKLMLVMGEYDDTLVRTSAGWRFARRELRTKVFTFLAELPLT